jgi:hypothetical protein
MHRRLSLPLIFLVLTVGGTPSVLAQYVPIDLGTLGGPYSLAFALNDKAKSSAKALSPLVNTATRSFGLVLAA